MAPRLTHQGKSLLLILLIFSLWWFLPIVFKKWTRATFYEFQAPAWTALSYLHDLQEYWSLRQRQPHELIEAGVDLARLNAAYSLRSQRLDYLQSEIERLEYYLDLPTLPEHRYEIARVIRRDMNNWWQSLTIRKGSVHGIKPGQAVIFSGGVAGRISEVHSYTSTVQLISSPEFRSAAHVGNDLRPIEYQGGINPAIGSSSGFVRNVPLDIEIPASTGLRVVSSALGGVFPDGYTIGFIDSLSSGPEGIFQSGKVRLDPRLQTVREVAVLVPLEPRNQEQEP